MGEKLMTLKYKTEGQHKLQSVKWLYIMLSKNTAMYLLYVVMWRALQIEVNSSTNESKGGFPTLPLRQSEAASTTGIPSMHRGQQQKIVR